MSEVSKMLIIPGVAGVVGWGGALALFSSSPAGGLGLAFVATVVALGLAARAARQRREETIAEVHAALGADGAGQGTLDDVLREASHLAHERKSLAAQLDSIPLPVVQIDPDYNMTYVNEAATEAMGMSAAQALGTKCYDVFRTGDCRSDKCALRRAMAQREVVSSETRANLPTVEKPLPIRYTGIPIYDDDGKVAGALEAVVSMAGIYDVLVDELQDMSVTLDDSVQSLGGTAGQMNEKAGDMLARAKDAAQQVVEVSSRLRTVSSTATEVDAQMTSVAAAVEEMSSSLEEIASHTARSADVAKTADQRAHKAAGIMDELSASTSAIGKVADIITQIADQTNLLALNATIEAASAGSAGAGFAVVAQEVKDLAKETTLATERIREQIALMQTNAGSAVGAVQDIAAAVDEMLASTQSVAAAVEEQSTAVHEISGHVQNTSAAYKSILSDVNDSASSAQHVANDVQEVQGAAEQTSEDTKSARARIADLADLTDRLRRTAQRFAQ